MAYTAVPTSTTGDLWTAANQNTYLRDNFAAGVPDIFTTKGDIAAATAANVASRLGIGSDSSQILLPASGEATGLKWASVVYRREGGDPDDWSADGTTDYTPTEALIQIGVGNDYATGDHKVQDTVTFPVAFGNVPWVNCIASIFGGTTGQNILSNIWSISASQVTFEFVTNDSTDMAGSGDNFDYHWIAIGPPA